jgi:hypothetical protein
MDHNSHAIECPGLYFGHFHIWDPLLALAGSDRVDGASPRRPPRVSLAKVLARANRNALTSFTRREIA